MPNPRLLLVTAVLAPSRIIGGRRADRIVAHLSRDGWDVSVLTLKPMYMRPVNATGTQADGFERIETHALAPRMWAREVVRRWARPRSERAQMHPARPAAGSVGAPPSAVGSAGLPPSERGRAGLAMRAAGQVRGLISRGLVATEFPDEFAGWRGLGLRALRGRRFDVVLGTLPPFTCGVLAHEAAQATGARLVLDYRDPWCDMPATRWSAPEHARHLALEDRCLAAADLVLGVTPTLCRWLALRTRAPVELVTNGCRSGAVPWRAADLPKGPPLRLAYTGSLAYGRDLGPLLAAMARARALLPEGALVLDYAGLHGAQLRASATAAGVADLVVDHGEVEQSAANALIRNAMAGVVVVSPEFDYAYPGKMFEILSESRPLLQVAPPQCDAARLVTEHALGWTHDLADIDGLAATLVQACRGDVPEPVRFEELVADHVMAKLAGLLAGLVK
ncbi:MAG: hypothetical protein EXR79_01630 [Myxococcales bacterium]|nr:hypothetical protein [Myxococcales bacterium]